MPSIFSKQPFKTLYLTYVVTTLLAFRLPLWVVLALPPFRPRQSWTFGKAFRLRLVRYLLTTLVPKIGRLIKVPDHRAIPNNLKGNVKGVWIEPVNESLIQGEVRKYAKMANVKPARIPGYWYMKKNVPAFNPTEVSSPDEVIILNFHGGGYVAQSAHPSDTTQFICRGVLEHFTKLKRVLSLEYRLARGPPREAHRENVFPTALVDALSAYNYLVNTLGFKPSNIIVMGDSAGANLTLALTRYLITNPLEALPLPAALILHSPWVDLGHTHDGPTSSLTLYHDSDYLGLATEPTFAEEVFTGDLPSELRATEPYISPASKALPKEIVQGMFTKFPDAVITSGGVEQLLDQIRTLEGRMKQDMGGRLTYIEAKDAFHDFLIFPWAEPERSNTLRKLAQWFDAWNVKRAGAKVSDSKL